MWTNIRCPPRRTFPGGKVFSKLDLSHAYQQILLDDESCKYVTINTHRGLYRYTRLPFGVASAPAIFQRTMERVLQGIPGVVIYLDDILITGKDENEHLTRLAQVLQCLEAHELRLKREKCYLMRAAVDYLGYHVDSEGLHPIASKVDAIVEAPSGQRVLIWHGKTWVGYLPSVPMWLLRPSKFPTPFGTPPGVFAGAYPTRR